MTRNKDINLEENIIRKLKILEPIKLELIDESNKHVGHQGIKNSGGRHYKLNIISKKFENLSLIKQHQLIYNVLGDLIGKEIHALKISCSSNQI